MIRVHPIPDADAAALAALYAGDEPRVRRALVALLNLMAGDVRASVLADAATREATALSFEGVAAQIAGGLH